MMAHRGLATCLTCSKSVSASLLPKCVIHSCCSRPVCPQCLEARPRLATFCPFCEGVDHAFRKGPRSDVTRAGQVLWDTERMLDETEELPEVSEEERRRPPPTYEESAYGATSAPSDFVLGGDEEEEEEEQRRQQSAGPSLLSSASSKALPSQSLVDRSLLATVTTPAPSPPAGGPSSTLRELSSARTRPSASTEETPALRASTVSKTSPPRPNADDDEEADGRTRQYWLRPNDSLQGLSLRFRVPAALLCKINALPLSTIHSTPHLVHTRPFLLIPEPAIAAALSQRDNANGSTATSDLEEALQGPRPLSAREKTKRARAKSEGRFRALVARSEAPSIKGKAKAADEIRCDERAARVYVGLVEEELDAVSGIANIEGETGRSRGKEEEEKDEAMTDAEREERFETIVKLAVSRWEMDSEWEREMRIKGLDPHASSMRQHAAWPSSATSSSGSSNSSSSNSNWLNRVFGSGASSRAPREHWQQSPASRRPLVSVGPQKRGE
ncbi:hypothetical protein FA10DRAFT_266207 [Acaromyces ingoldii]|uniref:LysM domain-containing protein n=1 Tax=Acaromyces ingoldii TaxID=215250 RepID=A0A316YSR3_9BASI|nr:hypothetical protein FA10DRAFT_266207 [Acaromyces ingoldii]PWN92447.1 hypothetical protein FA10DRAFT_266207 [Acaromyces ingoldii]